FRYVATAGERTALADSGMNAAQIEQFETNRTVQYHALHADVGGFTSTFQADFQYQASAEERASLTRGSSWTEAQHALSVGAGLLKEVTDTVVVIKEPNAKGRNVTLIAGQGIGSFDDPLQIDLSQGLGAITTEQKAALAAAERGDASVSGSIVTIVQPRPVNVETGALGALWADAGSGLAFIGSEGDLRIDQVQAAGDVRIKAAGSLVNAGSAPGAANVIGANLILESASGGIGGIPDLDSGYVATPLRIAPTPGSGVTARAAADIHLHAGADFAVDTLFSRHDVRLTADGSIVAAFLGNELNVLGENVIL